MRYLERKKRVEEKVYDAIEEIAEELDLEPDRYPEVYFAHKRINFEDLGISEEKIEPMEAYKSLKGSWYNDRPPIIILGKESLDDISEESAHFLYFNKSKIRISNRPSKDQFSLNIINELLAYFCSKLIFPDKRNYYKDKPDLFFMKPEERKAFIYELSKKNGTRGLDIASEFYLYQQARGLGERLYFAHHKGEYTIKEFRELFLCRFEKGLSPSQKILELKLRFWRPDNFKEIMQELSNHSKTPTGQ
jgi:hypothetical protein